MTALFSMCDDRFYPGFVAFIKSFLKHNPWFNLDFVILDVGLSEETKERMSEYYSNLIFVKPDFSKYNGVNFEKTHEKLRNTYYTLDVFKHDEYDRIVFIDLDTVVLGDISELFEFSGEFAACKGYNAKLDVMRADINSGVFVVNKPHIGEEAYREMVRIAQRGHSMPDQKVVNAYFRDRMSYFNKRYNVEKRMIATRNFTRVTDDIKILHFVASKPWDDEREPGFEKYEQIWWDYYNG